MKFNHILVSGCSMTSGAGLAEGRDDPALWVNIIAKSLDAKITNVAVTAGSNQLIFEEALTGLATIPTIDLLIVAWTIFPRFRFYPGNDNSRYIVITPGHTLDEITWFNGNLNQRDSNTLSRILLSLDEDVHNFTQLIRYSTILSRVAKSMNIPIVFVNAAIPKWSTDFFIRKDYTLNGGPVLLDELTKQLIQVSDRPDNDIFEIYNKIHNEFERMGDICLTKWANFDTSLYSLGIDKAIDNNHLGPKSNALYAEIILTHIKETQCQL